jgi:hypothetical protein
MSYLKLSTMQYPLYEGDIRLEHPEISEDETGDTFPVPADYVFIEDTPAPSINIATQYMYEDTPKEINGVWKRIWIVVDYTQAQLDAKEDILSRRKKQGTGSNNTSGSGSAPHVIG